MLILLSGFSHLIAEWHCHELGRTSEGREGNQHISMPINAIDPAPNQTAHTVLPLLEVSVNLTYYHRRVRGYGRRQ